MLSCCLTIIYLNFFGFFFNKVWLIDCWFCSVVQCHCIVVLSIIMTIMTIKSLWLQPWTANRVKQTEKILISLNTQTMDCACDLLHFSVVATKDFAVLMCQHKHCREFGIRVRSFDCCIHIRYVLAYWRIVDGCVPRTISQNWKREKENKNFSDQRSACPHCGASEACSQTPIKKPFVIVRGGGHRKL